MARGAARTRDAVTAGQEDRGANKEVPRDPTWSTVAEGHTRSWMARWDPPLQNRKTVSHSAGAPISKKPKVETSGGRGSLVFRVTPSLQTHSFRWSI